MQPGAGLPATIGPYAVQGLVGRGGMGSVLRARAPDGREVAVKVLHAPGDPTRLQRFDRERRLLDALGEAAGFVPLLDAGQGPTGPFLVMPLLAGGNLRERLRRGPLPVTDALALAGALAAALGRAHGRGIVHRDLKPENVLFDAAGRPFVADLGLAKHFLPAADTLTQGPTRTGQLMGTLSYMAPEQMRDAKSVGPPADVFALGAILYEALAGEPPFRGDTLFELISCVERGEVPPLEERRRDVPPALARLVRRALFRDPAGRPGDGAALARALERVRPDVARRRQVSLAAAAFVAVAVPAAALVRLGPRLATSTTEPPPPRTERPAPPLPSQPAPVDPRALAEGALQRLRQGDEAGAAEAASAALGLAPGLGLAWAVRARATMGPFVDMNGADVRETPPQAITDAERAAELDPSLALARAVRARVRIAKGDLAGADDDAREATLLAPDDPEAWLCLAAVARASKRDPRERIAAIDRALELDPGCGLAWCQRGLERVEGGERAEGRRDLERAVALDPRLASAWMLLATLRQDEGDLPAAIQLWSRAIEANPRLTVAWGQRAELRFRTGDDRRASADARRAHELDPESVDALLLLGVIMLGHSHGPSSHATMLDVLGRAVRLAPGDARTHHYIGYARHHVGDRAGAVAAWREAVRLDPFLDLVWHDLAVVLSEAGERDEALRAIERAAARRRTPAFLYASAVLRLLAGDRSGARAALEYLRTLPPDDAYVRRGREVLEHVDAPDVLPEHLRRMEVLGPDAR